MNLRPACALLVGAALAASSGAAELREHAAADLQRCTLEPAALPAPPAHFPAAPAVAGHTRSPLGVALGRALFFDPILSSTHQVSCASCHDRAHAFSIPEAQPARGVTKRRLERNAPALINLAWASNGLFWDGGAKNLESLALGPLTHEDEMGHSIELTTLLAELSADSTYRACFREVFGSRDVQLGHVLDALAQFQRSLVFASSGWDQRVLSVEEQTGEQVFTRDCSRCHLPPLFTDHGFHNIGLDGEITGAPQAKARGRMRVTQRAQDLGKFRTPSLRELGRSGPYMHDGRFSSISQVIEHYRRGMRDSETLDASFRSLERTPGVAMTDAEAFALELFLRALESQ